MCVLVLSCARKTLHRYVSRAKWWEFVMSVTYRIPDIDMRVLLRQMLLCGAYPCEEACKSRKIALGNWSFELYTDVVMTTGRPAHNIKL